MKRRKLLGLGPVGYTIIEVLVFLSVSGALLVAAGALISGRQERTLFSDGINDMTLQLQDTLNDVSTGLYSTNGSVRCEATAGGEIAVQPSGGQQGTSTNCIFSGKLINFPANSSDYTTYTMVSYRDPYAADFRSTDTELAGILPNAGIADVKRLPADIQVNKVIEKKADNTAGDQYNSLMIVSDFGTNDGSTVSGNAAKTQLYGYTGTISATPDFSSSSNFVKTIPSTSQVIICLSQPGGNNTQKAYLTITAQMTVENIVGGWDALC